MSGQNEHDTLPPSMDPAADRGTTEPPTHFSGILRRLGPGLIIAGSIVGSGELIATTKTGAQAGIALLWLIVIGCLIKVFVQIELGRYAISHGETTLSALDRVPGPRLKANWILWFWTVMMVCTVGQLGGIVGGVGQAMALTMPLKGDYSEAIRMPSAREVKRYLKWDRWLLSEWNTRLLLGSGKQAASAEPRNSGTGSLAELQRAQRRWLQRVRSRTRQRIELLNERRDGLGEQILSATRALMAAEESDDQERINAARDKLQQRLDRANRWFVQRQAAVEGGDETDAALDELLTSTEAHRDRVMRGQAVLARRLAELARTSLRPVRAAAAGWAARRTEAEVRRASGRLETLEVSLLESDEQVQTARRELALLKAEADYRNRVLSVLVNPPTWDDKLWAAVVAVFTAVLLFVGRYRLIQNVSIALVVSFTFITIGNVISLQLSDEFSIPLSEYIRGLSFGPPEVYGQQNPWGTALAAFGIIGVGATELIAYPYWCLEKGYARFAGRRSPDEAWARRARGWMKVMHYDAFASMGVYTVATVAFFVMGVAVLYNEGRDPDGLRMVSTLAAAYVPVFGEYAKWLFLTGAVAVLYSTFMVANAGNARMLTDALKVFGFVRRDSERSHTRSVTTLSVLLPLLCLLVFWSGANPVRLILVAGLMQALMLPIIGIGSIYFRYRLTDPRLHPSRLWDILLLLSCLGFLLAGGYGAWEQLTRMF